MERKINEFSELKVGDSVLVNVIGNERMYAYVAHRSNFRN